MNDGDHTIVTTRVKGIIGMTRRLHSIRNKALSTVRGMSEKYEGVSDEQMKEKLHLLSRHVSETAGSLLVNKIGPAKNNKSVSEHVKQMLHVCAVSMVQCC